MASARVVIIGDPREKSRAHLAVGKDYCQKDLALGEANAIARKFPATRGRNLLIEDCRYPATIRFNCPRCQERTGSMKDQCLVNALTKNPKS